MKRIKYSEDANAFASNVVFFSSDEEDRKTKPNYLKRNIQDYYKNVDNNLKNELAKENAESSSSLSFFKVSNSELNKQDQNKKEDEEIDVQNVFPEVPSYDFNQAQNNNSNLDTKNNNSNLNSKNVLNSNVDRSVPSNISPTLQSKASDDNAKKSNDQQLQRELELNDESSSSISSYIRKKNEALYKPRRNSNSGSQKSFPLVSTSDLDVSGSTSGQYARLVFCDNMISPEIQELRPSRRRSVGKRSSKQKKQNESDSSSIFSSSNSNSGKKNKNKRTEEEKNQIWDSLGKSNSKFTKQKDKQESNEDSIEIDASSSTLNSNSASKRPSSVARKSRRRQQNSKKVNQTKQRDSNIESLNVDFSPTRSQRPRAESVHSHHAYKRDENEKTNFFRKANSNSDSGSSKKRRRRVKNDGNESSGSSKANSVTKRSNSIEKKQISNEKNSLTTSSGSNSSSKRSRSVTVTKKHYEKQSESNSKKNHIMINVSYHKEIDILDE